MNLLKIVSSGVRKYWYYVLLVALLQLVATIAALWLPHLNARIINDGVAHGNTDVIWDIGKQMLLVCLLQLLAAAASVYFGAKAAMGAGRDLRAAVYNRAESLSTAQATQFGAGTLTTRATNDVQQIQMMTLLIFNFMVAAPIMCIGGIIMVIREDAGMVWLVCVAILLLVVTLGLIANKLLPLFVKMQVRLDAINSVLREQIMGIRVVRAFVREDFEAERFGEANKQITDVSVRIGNYFVLMFPAINLITYLASAAVLAVGAHRVDSGEMEIGSLIAFNQYLLQILMSVMMVVFVMMMIPRAAVCADRVSEVLNTEVDLASPDTQLVPTPTHGSVEFADVTFRFAGAEQPVLQHVSFRADPGKTTAIIGSTGSGKSTLLNILLYLFAPESGRVTVDGVEVSKLTREQIASTISLVPQKPYLFKGTIESNLRLGKQDASDEELWEALEIAQAADFVRAKPKQLAEPVSQGGTSVSGGQRQRLSIARSLVAKPLVYLFDDSFSALDVVTDAKLRAALADHTADATMIVVAQRVSTIRNADQIVVLDAGKVVGIGTHSELLAENEVYQEIVSSQLTAEEVQQ